MLLKAAKLSDQDIKAMFDPIDKQNVPMTCKLLKALAALSALEDSAVSATMLPQL